jgi:hypothetical protein
MEIIEVVWVVIGIVLNLLPSGVKAFSVKVPDQEAVMQCVLQADGSCKAMVPDAGEELLSMKGTAVTVKGDGRGASFDLDEVLGVDAGTDWKTVQSTVVFGNSVLTITTRKDGVDIAVTPREKRSVDDITRVYQVRWKPSKK